MSLQNAITCIKTIQQNNDFRLELYKNKNRADVEKFITEKGFVFSYPDLCDAYRMLLVKCQTEEDANELNHTLMMYQLLADIKLDIP